MAPARRTGPRFRIADWTTMAMVPAALLAVVIGFAAGVDPIVIIGATAAAAFAALVLSDVTLGLMCFGLVAFFEDLPGLGGGVSAAKAAGTLVALSWLATIAIRPKVRKGFFAAHPVASYMVLLLIAWMVLSITWAPSSSDSISAISRYVLNLLLLPIVYSAIRNRRHVFWLIGILVAGATLSALYGMVFARGDALAEGTTRLAGAGTDANYLASLLVSGIVLASALVIIRSVPTVVRIIALGSVLILLVALIDTVSRGGMIGLGAALLTGIVFAGRGRRLALIAITLVMILSVVGYYASVASPAARERITSVQSGSGRVDIWTVGWRIVKAHPVDGIGIGNFANSTKNYLFEPGLVQYSAFIVDEPKAAHNAYLEILAEVGVIGLALFLGIVAFLVSCGVRAAWAFHRAGDRAMDMICRAVVAATMGMLATDFFISDQFSKPLWIQLALCPALLAVARGRSSAVLVAT
jgi:putative inorganic carbon (hco3(-)) transporter